MELDGAFLLGLAGVISAIGAATASVVSAMRSNSAAKAAGRAATAAEVAVEKASDIQVNTAEIKGQANAIDRSQNVKLAEIHTLVNSRLTEALDTIAQLKSMLIKANVTPPVTKEP